MKYKINVKDGYDVESVLEKALKTVRQEEPHNKEMRDPYLRELQQYANEIYVKAMDSMIEEILDVLYEEKGIKKSKFRIIKPIEKS